MRSSAVSGRGQRWTGALMTDIPVEVTLADGSRWLTHYRLSAGKSYVNALEWVSRDIREGALRPASDVDGVQRRLSQINMAFVVSVREVDGSASSE